MLTALPMASHPNSLEKRCRMQRSRSAAHSRRRLRRWFLNDRAFTAALGVEAGRRLRASPSCAETKRARWPIGEPVNRIETAQAIAQHFQQQGSFNPFSYAVGLESSVPETQDSLQPYPLPDNAEPWQVDAFIKSLTYFHEATHVCQFTCTAYGLRTLRYTFVLATALGRRPGWQMPILQNLYDKWLDGRKRLGIPS